MVIVKPKDVSPFGVFSLFGQSYDGYKYADRLFRLFQEIGFKRTAVSIAFNLIQDQEKTIRDLHKNNSQKGRSYEPEVRQMAYVGFFLDSTYALTEKISQVTKIFHGKRELRDGFNKQREDLLQSPKLNPALSALLERLDWYDLYHEVRVEHTHYGTHILAFGYDKDNPEAGSSQLIIEVAGRKKKKVLTTARYNFDLRKTKEILSGMDEFIQQWALVLLKKLDMSTPFMDDKKSTLTLSDFMEGRA